MASGVLMRLAGFFALLVLTSASTANNQTKQITSYEKCNVFTERLGCYKDGVLPSRPLPELLFTDRDSTSPAFTGGFIDLKNWNLYMEDLRCRCAEETRAKGYKVFGLQFYGECWSGPKANETYTQSGESDQCVTHDLAHCTEAEEDCVGRDYTNFVYEIHESPVLIHNHNTTHHVNMSHTLAANITIVQHNHTINNTEPTATPHPTNEVPRYVPMCIPFCLPQAPPPPPPPCPMNQCQPCQPWPICYRDENKKPRMSKLWRKIYGLPRRARLRASKFISHIVNAIRK